MIFDKAVWALRRCFHVHPRLMERTAGPSTSRTSVGMTIQILVGVRVPKKNSFLRTSSFPGPTLRDRKSGQPIDTIVTGKILYDAALLTSEQSGFTPSAGPS
jgi:hypothetical protein